MEKRLQKSTITQPRRIVLTGPESTGKTSLAKQLAGYYNSCWIPEYARRYVEKLDRQYRYDDVEHIARKQLEQYRDTANRPANCPFVFFDTFLIITKVWFLDVYKKMPSWLDVAIRHHPIDLYLLCNTDMEWQYDEVRENPHRRDFFFDWYKKELDKHAANYKIINGNFTGRFEQAIKIIDTFAF